MGEDGPIFLKTSMPLYLMTTYQKSLFGWIHMAKQYLYGLFERPGIPQKETLMILDEHSSELLAIR
jgi:hypothetical protein